MADVMIGALDDAPTEEVAEALAAAFGDRGEAAAQWQHMLIREVASGRADRRCSRLARVDGAIVGVCIANRGPGGLGRIGPTGVLPKTRRRGVGRALVEAALAALGTSAKGGAARSPCRRITLEVAPENAAAVQLYAGLGFVPGRSLRILSGRRSTLGPPGPAAARPVDRLRALDAIACLHPEVPAYQRQPFYLESFDEGVLAHGVERADGSMAGAVLQRGRALLDVAAAEPDREAVVRALLWAASEHAWELRLINVPDDDPVGDVMERIGFHVEARATEMVQQLGRSSAGDGRAR